MIEVYVALSLLSLGYLLNQNKTAFSSLKRHVDTQDLPSQDSLHESRHLSTVDKIEKKKAHRAHELSKIKQKNGIPKVIHKNYGYDRQQQSQNPDSKQQNHDGENGNDMIYSPLLDKKFTPQEFVHNNMVHFIKPKNETSENPDALQSKLETFTGVSAHYQPKHETPSFFEPQKNMSFIHGTPNVTDFQQERMPVPNSHNNVTPFKQERVGPGLGLGFTTKAEGGFQQFDVQNYAKPKTVDELRVKSNPKTTFEGRVIHGQKGSERGKIGEVFKNRVDKFFKNTPDMYLKTTGAYLKGKQHPKYNAKITNRQNTSSPYSGVAYDKSKQSIVHPKTQLSQRQQLDKLNKGHANISHTGKGNSFDYGKKNIMVYANERDVTATKTYEGNVSSVLKALIAPFDDVFRFSKKEFYVENPRTYGQMDTQFPSKMPVYDPNDVARTTIKETTLNEADTINLKGHQKATVYDPNDVARTTIKETVLSEAELTNLKGPVKAFVYDANDIARTTVKETTLNEADTLNFRGHRKGTVYDPNDIARTTVKETTLNEAEKANLRGYAKSVAYDPNDIARTTIKETTLQPSDTINLHGERYEHIYYDPDDEVRPTPLRQNENDASLNLQGEVKNYVYDPNDVARTTVKETIVDQDYIGNMDHIPENRGEYREDNYQMKDTHKQYLSDNPYIGVTDSQQMTAGDGYKVAPTDVKNTARQFTSDHEYYGSSSDKDTFRNMSYEDIYNAEMDDNKESILHRRDPVHQGDKVSVGGDSINIDSRHNDIPVEDLRDRQFDNNKDRLTSMNQYRLPVSQDSITRLPCESKRIDDRFISATIDPSKNPFVTSII